MKFLSVANKIIKLDGDNNNKMKIMLIMMMLIIMRAKVIMVILITIMKLMIMYGQLDRLIKGERREERKRDNDK